MEKKDKKDKFPYIDQEVALSGRGAFYHKPICFPAVVDENGIIIPNGKAAVDEVRLMEERQI